MREEVDRVIAAFAEQARRTLEHDRLSIYLLTDDGQRLERFAVATSPTVPGESEIIDLDEVGLARVLRRNEPVISSDFGVDSRLVGREDALIAAAGFRAIVSVPLRTGGVPFGLLNFVSRTAGFYDGADIDAAQRIADQISGFLINLRLQRTMRIAAGREAMERERNRVAREFHDGLAQGLAEITLKANAIIESVTTLDPLWGPATALRDLTQRALEDVRRSLHDLMPTELEGKRLDEAVRLSLDELSSESGCETYLVSTGEFADLPDEVRVTVFRILQQALTNARRHAHATAVTVELHRHAELTLIIRDDGVGFEVPAQSPGVEVGGTFGLKIMRDRAASIGAELEVTSRPHSGTEVRFRLPEHPVKIARASLTAQTTPLATMRRIIRVLIVDDHAMLRESLADLLRHRDDIRVVGQAADGREALRAVQRQKPDIVLLDLDLPDMTGVQATSMIVERHPDTTVLLMSGFAHPDMIAQGLAAGARGYLDKSTSLEPMLRAIRSAALGVDVFVGGGRPAALVNPLTPRELQVVTLLARGLTNAEIAGEMHLAIKTIERIVATALTKLDARNRTHAVTRALSLRVISLRDLE